MFDRPSCPNCERSYLVVKMRTHGYPRTETEAQKRYYKCFRCFESFTPEDDDPIAPEANVDL